MTELTSYFGDIIATDLLSQIIVMTLIPVAMIGFTFRFLRNNS